MHLVNFSNHVLKPVGIEGVSYFSKVTTLNKEKQLKHYLNKEIDVRNDSFYGYYEVISGPRYLNTKLYCTLRVLSIALHTGTKIPLT